MSNNSQSIIDALKDLEKLAYSGGFSRNQQQQEVEKIDAVAIAPKEGEKLAFNEDEKPYSECRLMPQSVVCAYVLDTFSKIFKDLRAVTYEFIQPKESDSNNDPRPTDPVNNISRYVFKLWFDFITDQQWKDIDTGKGETRALVGAYDPNTGNCFAESMIATYNSATYRSNDVATKYIKISEEAKQYFINLIIKNKSKVRKFTEKENYIIGRQVNSGYNGQQFANLTGVMILNADKVISMLCTTKEEKEDNLYSFIMEPISMKNNGQDVMIRLTRINNREKEKFIRANGVQFTQISDY